MQHLIGTRVTIATLWPHCSDDVAAFHQYQTPGTVIAPPEKNGRQGVRFDQYSKSIRAHDVAMNLWVGGLFFCPPECLQVVS